MPDIMSMGAMWMLQNLVLPLALVGLAGYFFGCFNGAVIVSKYILKDDVRNHGSGNAGLTNFHRTTDMLKAFAAVGVGMLVATFWADGLWQAEGMLIAKYWAGLCCLLGHMFPVSFGFRGGKGILSGGAVVMMIDWRLALLAWGGFILLTALTRFVSLGSIYAASSVPVGTYLFVSHDWLVVLLSACIGGLIVWKHRANAMRLIRGTESKLSFSKKKKEGG